MPEKRTALNLTPDAPLCLKETTTLSFDLNFIPYHDIYFGYVLRIIFTNRQNIDLVYNQKTQRFDFLIGETFSKTFTIDSAALYQQWNHCSIKIDPARKDVSLYINNKLVAQSQANLGDAPCCRLLFGANNFEGFQMMDIPPMNIRDIVISEDSKEKYYWPLGESAGKQCRDTIHGKIAEVRNASWIRPQHQDWALAGAVHTKGTPSVAFDRESETLYIVAADSLYKYDFKQMSLSGIALAAKHDTLLPGNQSIYDPFLHRLYNFYIDQRKVNTFDTLTQQWSAGFTPGPLTEFWHANKFISAYDSSMYIMGGYGQLEYKNRVQRYHMPGREWDTLLPVQGDRFSPRYLAALGTNKRGDTAYIMGGYGSSTGDQVVNPKYYYDLLRFSVKDRSFKTLYRLAAPDRQFCFANSMVIDETEKVYYALVYPNGQFNSSLQLVRGSLEKPEYQLLGNTFPYRYHDVQSFADLYYCANSKQLAGITIYTDKDQHAEVKIYTIAFPPNQLLPATPPHRGLPWWYYVALLAAPGLVLLAYITWRRKQLQRQAAALESPVMPIPVLDRETPAPLSVPIPPEYAPARVCLFGQFEVYDKDGQDITRCFTPLLKELFLIITTHTLWSGKGISAEKLYTTLWRDKSSKEAQNNRSVNMVKLKAILDKLGPCNFVKEADRWSLHYTKDDICIDLEAFLHLCKPAGKHSKEEMQELLQIIQRGSLLADTAYPWLEDMQSEISGMALSVLSAAALQFQDDPDFLIEIANGIFIFDPVNEEALRLKCKSLGQLGRHSMAKALFNKFAKEYYHMYGEDFQGSFQEVFS
ncbi:bacterial transcriptional activator domain-containing protein [Chitinophaga agrisoli]|uniref:bacterial transcriptional activator domain-containing protein n=1 Tax=Chitinophaga agrisoli TaxID=2607653 RepID=UPI001661D710|nr:galactose oxidase [Chitinophaga agrisoli]